MASIERFTLGELVDHCGAFSPSTPVMVKRHGYSSETAPVVSLVVPVHNQEQLIAKNLECMRTHSLESHELVVIVDGCTDETSARVDAWAKALLFEDRTVGVTVATVAEGVFETICDSIGARLAVGEYLIEVQADMSLTQAGFDRVLLAALSAAPALVAVSGRGAHSFSQLGGRRSRSPRRIVNKASSLMFNAWAFLTKGYAPSRLEMYLSDQIGRVANLIDHPATPKSRRRVYVHETIMRGPFAIARCDFEMLGGFDTEHFFLGNDDHDLALRALMTHRRRVGYTPIGFDSPMEVGSTRAPRTPESKRRFEELQDHYDRAFEASVLGKNPQKYPRPRRYSVAMRRQS